MEVYHILITAIIAIGVGLLGYVASEIRLIRSTLQSFSERVVAVETTIKHYEKILEHIEAV